MNDEEHYHPTLYDPWMDAYEQFKNGLIDAVQQRNGDEQPQCEIVCDCTVTRVIAVFLIRGKAIATKHWDSQKQTFTVEQVLDELWNKIQQIPASEHDPQHPIQ